MVFEARAGHICRHKCPVRITGMRGYHWWWCSSFYQCSWGSRPRTWRNNEGPSCISISATFHLMFWTGNSRCDILFACVTWVPESCIAFSEEGGKHGHAVCFYRWKKTASKARQMQPRKEQFTNDAESEKQPNTRLILYFYSTIQQERTPIVEKVTAHQVTSCKTLQHVISTEDSSMFTICEVCQHLGMECGSHHRHRTCNGLTCRDRSALTIILGITSTILCFGLFSNIIYDRFLFLTPEGP